MVKTRHEETYVHIKKRTLKGVLRFSFIAYVMLTSIFLNEYNTLLWNILFGLWVVPSAVYGALGIGFWLFTD